MKLYTTKQLAKLLGYSDDSVVRNAIARGTIKAKKIGHFWVINQTEASRLLKRRNMV